jgi:outer membrane protein TolC
MQIQAASFAILGALALLPAPGTAQERPVSLAEAVAEAQSLSPDVLMAEAHAAAAKAGARASGAFRWPGLALEAGALRSNDPVAAFGGRLRQGRFTEMDFDPARLNAPSPQTDWGAGVVMGWAPLDLAALSGFRASQAEAEAAGEGVRWARRAAGFRAQVRYLEAVGAAEYLAATETALRSAEENARVTSARRDEGLLMEADLLQARAALEGARAGVLAAQRALGDARGRLGLALGWPGTQLPIPTDTVFTRPEITGGVLQNRPDLRASALAVQASEARVHQAFRARLPRLEAFGRLGTHAPEPFTGVEENWTLGFQLRVPLFAGFALGSSHRVARAQSDAIRREAELYRLEAEVELAEANRALSLALQGAEAATQAANASGEAARLMRRRFEEGLVTTADLLQVEAQAAALAARRVQASLEVQLAAAHLAFLSETDESTLTRHVSGDNQP